MKRFCLYLKQYDKPSEINLNHVLTISANSLMRKVIFSRKLVCVPSQYELERSLNTLQKNYEILNWVLKIKLNSMKKLIYFSRKLAYGPS